MITTTLNAIREHNPCTDGWEKLLKYLGKTNADDDPLALTTILDSNGLYDALWCLRAVDGHDREIRLYAIWCAKQVQHLVSDQRSIAALDVAGRYANGEVTDDELMFAWDGAAVSWSAARAMSAAAEFNAADAAANAASAAFQSAASRAAERKKQEEMFIKMCLEVIK